MLFGKGIILKLKRKRNIKKKQGTEGTIGQLKKLKSLYCRFYSYWIQSPACFCSIMKAQYRQWSLEYAGVFNIFNMNLPCSKGFLTSQMKKKHYLYNTTQLRSALQLQAAINRVKPLGQMIWQWEFKLDSSLWKTSASYKQTIPVVVLQLRVKWFLTYWHLKNGQFVLTVVSNDMFLICLKFGGSSIQEAFRNYGSLPVCMSSL